MVCDFEDINEIIANEKCVAVSYKSIQNFVIDGKINFRFIIKQIKDNHSATTEDEDYYKMEKPFYGKSRNNSSKAKTFFKSKPF